MMLPHFQGVLMCASSIFRVFLNAVIEMDGLNCIRCMNFHQKDSFIALGKTDNQPDGKPFCAACACAYACAR